MLYRLKQLKKKHHFNSDNLMTTTSVYINLPILPTKNKSLEKKRWMFYLVYGITHIKKKTTQTHSKMGLLVAF